MNQDSSLPLSDRSSRGRLPSSLPAPARRQYTRRKANGIHRLRISPSIVASSKLLSSLRGPIQSNCPSFLATYRQPYLQVFGSLTPLTRYPECMGAGKKERCGPCAMRQTPALFATAVPVTGAAVSDLFCYPIHASSAAVLPQAQPCLPQPQPWGNCPRTGKIGVVQSANNRQLAWNQSRVTADPGVGVAGTGKRGEA